MEWEQKTPDDDRPVYRSGIYKLVSYVYHRGEAVSPYWRAYLLLEHNWGEHVPGLRGDDQLTLSQAMALCERHAAGYKPTDKEVTASNRAWAAI